MATRKDDAYTSDLIKEKLSFFRDPAYAQNLIDSIHRLNLPNRKITLMEVCGTHTVSIARNAIGSLMPENIHLASGPGCPVCVTSNADIDKIVALAKLPDVIIATFGDMVRVPGSTSSLLKEQAHNADIRIVYSPLDALQIAHDMPDREVVFIGVGFETTTPLVAMAIKRAKDKQLRNFSVFSAHKSMPGALDVIVNDPEVSIDALILPGHVSTIIGRKPYEFLAKRYNIPGVITGFEPNDILQGIAMIMRQIHEGCADIEIAYARAVMDCGNLVAQKVTDEVFVPCDATWRGLGLIKNSGYKIRSEFSEFDAMCRFSPVTEKTVEHTHCRCGDVLRGAISPDMCPLFKKVCTPESPVGPCMVSSEGSCAAYFRYL